MPSFRKHLSIPGLLTIVRSVFSTLSDHRKKGVGISLPDALMSTLAMFLLKYPSLLKFDEERNEEIIRHNLRTLYRVKTAPCDTQMREILDPIDPLKLRSAFVSIFNEAQRGGVLEQYKYLDDFYVVTLDATGQYSSGQISCPECCVSGSRSCRNILIYKDLFFESRANLSFKINGLKQKHEKNWTKI